MDKRNIWIGLAIVAIIVLLVAGFLPLPGQKDKVTPHVQPSPPAPPPAAEVPKGPPEAK